jgi:Cys-tRNA(Pro) deacylase
MTPAVQAAKRAGIEYRLHEYQGVEVGDGDYAVAVADALAQPHGRLFKTLVASVDGRLEVFVVPADRQLDLRAAGKRVTLADRAAAERATGYVVGGISPLGLGSVTCPTRSSRRSRRRSRPGRTPPARSIRRRSRSALPGSPRSPARTRAASGTRG